MKGTLQTKCLFVNCVENRLLIDCSNDLMTPCRVAALRKILGGTMASEKEMQLRRLALVLMSQIPDDPDDALRVLEYASELVRHWMLTDGRQERGRPKLHSVQPAGPRADNDQSSERR